ncbi:UNVERIFIED_CONTAM: hypothetical protein K2H54_055081 [Gekko kuhli]
MKLLTSLQYSSSVPRAGPVILRMTDEASALSDDCTSCSHAYGSHRLPLALLCRHNCRIGAAEETHLQPLLKQRRLSGSPLM